MVWAAVLALSVGASALPASAQDEGYAWGEEGGGGDTGQSASSDDPLRIMGYLGGGIGFRLLANLDFGHTFIAPGYLDLGGAVFLPGRELRHGIGLYLSSNLSEDAGGQTPFSQWSITPSYNLLLPLWRIVDGMTQDDMQVQIRVGVPIVIAQRLGDPEQVNVTFGGELAAAFQYKFLAGFGVYVEAQLDLYGGYDDTVHPIVALDAGFVIDYEVLP
ncbi:MAG: hypothetical protein KC619_23430 [Myxococcales bacterium]|nr:hypothetical protein [Myxococcales bacterium]